ncbi:MAG: TIGR02757 family protein [Spirochaetia bacterium]|nr:TIGR02757 family protein [Spirochaetia bacterium]
MIKNSKTGLLLEEIYLRYHKPEYINPDPLVFVRKYGNIKDREIAALIASAFALGRVELIMAAVEKVLSILSSPFDDLYKMEFRDFEKLYDGFSYRFFKTSHLAGFLSGIGKLIKKYGSAGECFKKHYEDKGVLVTAVHSFSRELIAGCERHPGILVTESWKGSAFKRFNLFLRWMVRSDNIDPGGWDFVKKSELIIPLDTHMMKIGSYIGLTGRNTPSLKTAMEITENLKKYDKIDPVRFDFSLTRLGIHPDLTIEDLKLLEGKKK